ncbi:winged helix-turn-helix transcriptional regulator [Paenibacillus sp. HJL G12]|uniref:Winged helix-turn-helix transcriptional regulator n=1 Tax=Paenibacillus dendrobii TaxID=2691084 RepID=A0A7X3IF29_9BACL|nr:metalloregulator ArsR/SmtB family transcription factor [Paenibacillus dendrobii]MWV42418.1 winged helix-turn-helix transcriptional regulator [Paenibacillus dendrobii]
MDQQLDISTRDKILQLLKTKGDLSAKEITEFIGITSMAVRRHINTLEKDGLIESKTIRQPMGRPTAIYHLTEQAETFFPNKYHTLTLDLLGELELDAGSDMVDRLFERRGESLRKNHAAKMHGKSFAEKVEVLAEIQNENGYMVELQKNNEHEYTLMEYNCPISQIAKKYNHACTCEMNMFESLLGAEVGRTECLAKGDKKCVYTIKNKKELSH